MTIARRCAVVLAGVFSLVAIAAGQQQGPTFRTGVDLIRLDVTVVGSDGTPVDDLETADFEIRVNGQAMAVRSLQYLDLRPKLMELPAGTSLAASRDYAANDASMTGRLLVIVVDQDSVPFGAARRMLEAAGTLVTGLGPQDRAALVAIPAPGPLVDFTSDVRLVLQGLRDITGRTNARFRQYRVTFDEAVAIERGNRMVLDDLVDRQCRFLKSAQCASEIGREARLALLEGRERIQATLTALDHLTASLRHIDGPKTVVLLSGGLAYEDAVASRFKALARDAANARLQMYIVYADTFEFDAADARQSAAFSIGTGRKGLETISGLTGGPLMHGVGAAAGVFQRIVRESQGSYVLGIEPPPATSKDDALAVDVRVRRRGVTVRSPRQVVPPQPPVEWPSPETALAYTLAQPRPARELPLRVSTYTFRGEADDRLTVRVGAEFPAADISPATVRWALAVSQEGRLVAEARNTIPPDAEASAAAGAITADVDLRPGQYTLRFAAMDQAGRRGSIEQPLTVGLRDAGIVQLSDLMVGWMDSAAFVPATDMADQAKGLAVLLELYADDPEVLNTAAVEFVLRGRDGASRAVKRISFAASQAQTYRRIAEATLPVEHVSAGSYTVEATILIGSRAIGKVRRDVFLSDRQP